MDAVVRVSALALILMVCTHSEASSFDQADTKRMLQECDLFVKRLDIGLEYFQEFERTRRGSKYRWNKCDKPTAIFYDAARYTMSVKRLLRVYEAAGVCESKSVMAVFSDVASETLVSGDISSSRCYVMSNDMEKKGFAEQSKRLRSFKDALAEFDGKWLDYVTKMSSFVGR